MSTLKRAPRPCGTWFWDLEDFAPAGLDSALVTASRMAEVLLKQDLLLPQQLEYGWFVYGSGGINIRTTLALTVPLSDASLPDRVRASRPVGFSDAEVDDLYVTGPGHWLDAVGESHREPRLVELSVSPAPVGLSAELAVYHDIWAWFDFSGRPHPDVHRRNAPRLAAALKDLNELFGVDGEPGEPTIFGAAAKLGVATPEPYDDGLGPDVTDSL
ncbi:hypothetical protein AV521_46045 [Streptomyces sp. IMTB 2501]|uniref:hypothetical protein n=1 Tax=Streptomyces sp. IMTB 2501 TaxID=1776340 RepID=UPI00096E8C5C|nr:hypothetical protein [Streptomyces sp. IMTB 2501]OLZ59014.1 hypothetical protein AV521_46045 [Streptomyces sp. IMTB 2501]